MKKYCFEPTIEEINTALNCASASEALMTEQRSFFAYGFGKQPVSVYMELEQMGYEVLWRGFKGPFWARAISSMASSQYGLIKINKFDTIIPLAHKLSHLGMVGLYSFDILYEDDFVTYLTNNNYRRHPEDIVLKDDTHFSMLIDGDNQETSSGQLCLITFGDECPLKLKEITKNYGEIGYFGTKSIFVE